MRLLAALVLITVLVPLGLPAQPRITGIATRAFVGTGDNLLIAGLTIEDGGAKTLLLRAVGPTLATYGVSPALADPRIQVYSGATLVAANDDWPATLAADFATLGLGALPFGSKDSALRVTLAPGNYTVQVGSTSGGTGVALLEVYELDATQPRLRNISARTFVGTGNALTIPSFALSSGTGTRRLLVRVSGPTLASYGVAGALADPRVTVATLDGTALGSNDDWETPADAGAASADLLRGAFSAAGLGDFQAGSKDAALLGEFAAGNYTFLVRGAGETTGVVLVEAYDVTGLTITPRAATGGSGTAIATAGNGEAILSPLATATTTTTDSGKTVRIPHGMVYVPAGSFTYGTGTTATSVTLDGFCLGKFEVTNAEWAEYLQATGGSAPRYWSGGTYPAGKAAHPVLYVSLVQAQAYCAWIAAKTGWNVFVPSAEQWEKAARGPAGYTYPWGNAIDASSAGGKLTTHFNYNGVCTAYYLANLGATAASFNDTNSPYYGRTMTVATIAGYDTSGNATLLGVTSSGGVNGWINHDTYTGFVYTDLYDALVATGGFTTAVGTYENGQSAYGCYDMAGNAYEWTTSMITATNGTEAGTLVNEVRGGSWYSTGASGKSLSIGEGRSASGGYHSVGFRIGATVP